jgi:hypothetical protein
MDYSTTVAGKTVKKGTTINRRSDFPVGDFKKGDVSTEHPEYTDQVWHSMRVEEVIQEGEQKQFSEHPEEVSVIINDFQSGFKFEVSAETLELFHKKELIGIVN